MPASKFEELVREYAEREKTTETEAPALRQSRIQWWKDRVDALLGDINQWLSPLVQPGPLKIDRAKVNLEEESLGRYEIASEIIGLGPRRLTLNPIGTIVIGALGRIDVSGPNGKAMLLLVAPDDSTASTQDRMINASWFVSHPLSSGKARAQQRELRPLTKETFQDLFTDLFGIG